MRILLSRPHMGGEELDQVRRAFEANYIAPAGPQLAEFEEAFAGYLGEGVHCLAVASGSAALHLALHMLEPQPDDEIWDSSMTFAGGVFPILYARATPVFLDLTEESWTLDPDLLAEELARADRHGRLPKAIVPTDLYGQSCDIEALEAVAERYGVPLVVDSAESAGASCRGRKAGTGGEMAILSFNGNKIITTGGGGMLVSRSHERIEQARFLSTQARDPAPHYQHSVVGFNYRLSNVSAAIGIGQLGVLDDRVRRRRRVFQRYAAALGDIAGVSFMPEPEWSRGTRWLTAVAFDPSLCGATREDVRLMLAGEGIESRPLWKPMHLQPLFAGTRYVGRGFDEKLFEHGLCLPSGSDLTEAEQDEVIALIKQCLGR